MQEVEWLYPKADTPLLKIEDFWRDSGVRKKSRKKVAFLTFYETVNLQFSIFNLQFLLLARPRLHQKSEFRFDRPLIHVLRVGFGPLDELADRFIARRQRIGHANEFDSFRTTCHGFIVLVGAFKIAMAEIDGLVVKGILG